MSKLTTSDFLNPIHFDSPIYSYEDVYVIEVPCGFFSNSRDFFGNRLVEIYYTHITESSKKNILVVFNISISSFENGYLRYLTVENYTQLTNDFTQYLDYMLLGKELNEDNLYPKILADDIEPKYIDHCQRTVEILRLFYPSKDFQYILLPEQYNGVCDGLDYIMNIGGTGFTPIKCEVDIKGNWSSYANWGLNPKDDYKECLDNLLNTNFTQLGKKIFIVFTCRSGNPKISDLVDANWDSDNNELYFAENFRILLSDYINNILFDSPLRFFRNRFEEFSKIFYSLHPYTEESRAETENFMLECGLPDAQRAQLHQALEKISELKPCVRKLMDEYVNELKNRYPEIEFRYIVLPMTELRRSNIILNLKTTNNDSKYIWGMVPTAERYLQTYYRI